MFTSLDAAFFDYLHLFSVIEYTDFDNLVLFGD